MIVVALGAHAYWILRFALGREPRARANVAR
jgi:hypothetical protein